MTATIKKQNKNLLKGLNSSLTNPNASDSEKQIFSCKSCGGKCLKNGIEKTTQKQRYICKVCGKRQQSNYSYNGYNPYLKENLAALVKEGVGIRGASRLLGISANTVLKKIVEMGKEAKEPALENAKTYEVDELRTYIKKKTS